jgi:outer membrane protein OmpA-like peptidoglycan-associated protein
LLAQAAPSLGNAPRVVVIDPLIDANTGQQTRSTVRMGELISYKIRNAYPHLTPKPLTRAALAGSPILMIGTLTPINTANAPEGPIDAYRVWLTLIDLKTGKIVGKALDRATVDSVDSDPTAYYQDSPTWHKDKTIAAYINSCQVNSKVGDYIDPAYLMRLPSAALINEALLAFDSGNMQDANQLFRDASTTAESGDLRVWNGLYLTSWRLGRKDDAQKAFSHVAAAGIAAKKLPLKMLFAPGKAVTLQTGDLPKQYDLWVREIAVEAASAKSCLRVSGHTTRTGAAAANEALSLARASFVQQRMETLAPQLKGMVSAVGVGAKENLVGIATDDARDILDRRVEFGVVDCKSSGA